MNYKLLLAYICMALNHTLSQGNENMREYYNKINFESKKNLYMNFVQEGDLVFDVGANIGEISKIMLACGAKVICIEPNSECVEILKKEFSQNKLVFIEEVGLAEKAGYLEFFTNPNGSGISTFSKEYTTTSRFAIRDHYWETKGLIKVETLDFMIKKYGIPKFCKIDVEGFEEKVLKGLHFIIPCISFEINIECEENWINCLKILTKLGYSKFNFVIANLGEFAFDEWVSSELFIENIKNLSKSHNWESIWGLWGDAYCKQ